jgi:hypothetical protein
MEIISQMEDHLPLKPPSRLVSTTSTKASRWFCVETTATLQSMPKTEMVQRI